MKKLALAGALALVAVLIPGVAHGAFEAAYPRNSLNFPTVDGAYLTDRLGVSGDPGRVTDIRLSIRMDHARVGDLRIALIAPDGRGFQVMYQNGGEGDNLGTGSDCETDPLVIDDAAEHPPISGGTAPFSDGPYSSSGGLNPLTGGGVGVTGQWRLEIFDVAGGATGTLICWKLELERDTEAPDLDIEGPGRFVLSDEATVNWTADDEQGIYRHYATVYSKRYNASGFPSPRASFESESPGVTLPLTPGFTYCVVPTVMDNAGTTTFAPFDEVPCFGSPVDDRGMARSAGDWKSALGAGYYQDTISSTKKKNSTISLTDVDGTGLALVVAKGPGYGRVRVHSDTGPLTTISLDANKVKKRVVIPIELTPELMSGSHTYAVTVISQDKPVKIDGFGVVDPEYT